MAAAAALRPLLHRAAAVKTSNTHSLHHPASQLHLPKTKPLLPLRSLSASRRCLRATSFAAYAETDNEEEYGEEDDGEEEDGEEESQERQQPPVPKSLASGDNRRLYVGNLPYSLTSAQLADVFSQAGTVATVEIVYDRVTDRSRGFGFVTMGNEEEASNAIRMYDGALVGGRTVKVNFPEVPRGGEREVLGPRMRRGSGGFTDSPYKVYAGNLGWTVTSESLRDAFAAQPGVLSAKVVYNRDSGLSRGFGFISFASQEEAQAAIDNMNEKEVGGRPLRLSHAAGSPARTSQTREQLPEVEF